VALILKGFSPGAAYVFLVAGPATNAATLAILMRVLGKKQTLFYLGTIITGSLVFGLAMNGLTALTGWEFAGSLMEHHMMFSLWDYLFAGFFALLLAGAFYRKFTKTESCSDGCCSDSSCSSEKKGQNTEPSCCSDGCCSSEEEERSRESECCSGSACSCQGEEESPKKETVILIEGMNCHHCSATVKDALESVEGTEEAEVDLKGKKALVKGQASEEELKAAVVKAGYRVVS
ncbi:MAG: cation transporter, partial [Spirochaetales bacterium]|nr:cation transporter [Spirochaetales bacterium]